MQRTSNDSSQDVSWPKIAWKHGLEAEVIEPEQIIVVESFLTSQECRSLIKFIDSLTLEVTPPPKRGEATRLNHRASITSSTFAATLFDLLVPHLPPLPSFQTHMMNPEPRPILCNSNIRLYKYTEGQYFGPHYDESVAGPSLPVPAPPPAPTAPITEEATPHKGMATTSTGKHAGQKRSKQVTASPPQGKPTWSEWTILVYLSGAEDGIVGGETVFYVDEGRGKSRTQRLIVPPLKRGSVLLHKHGKECLLHEGRLVQRGTKYVLRSDLMFGRIPGP